MSRQDLRKEPTRPIDHAVIIIVGAILFGFLVAFERWTAGSWRELGAMVLAMVVWFGGAFALDAGLRRIGGFAPGSPPPVWLLAVLPGLGAAAGSAYSLAASGHLGPSVSMGALAGVILAVLNFRQIRRKRSAASSPPAA